MQLPHPPHTPIGLPPHLRNEMVRFDYDSSDLSALARCFGDTDTANAALMILHSAPPEVKLLFYLITKHLVHHDKLASQT